MAGKQVLLPRSDRVDDRLPSALREAGRTCSEVVAYRTLRRRRSIAKFWAQVRAAEIDAIVFASPSAFHNLAAFVSARGAGRAFERVQFARSVPPLRARYVRPAVRVAIESNDSSSAGLTDAIAKYYQRQTSTVRHA